jgi:hypothetical protein
MEKHFGMRVEGDYERLSLFLPGRSNDLLEDETVSQVYAVEIADGHYRVSEFGRYLVRAFNDDHVPFP